MSRRKPSRPGHGATRPAAAGGVSATPARPATGPGARPPLFPLGALLDPREPFLLPLVVLVVTRIAFLFFLPLAAEDAYITFRYSRALASGLGAVYNPGERVMGFTSPVWMLWNAAGFALLKDPALWSRITNVVLDALSLVLFADLLRRRASRASAWAFAFFFAAWPFFSAMVASGMECGLVLALIALGAALVERAHPAAGPALALLALTRPEGIASAAVLGLGARWRDRMIALAIVAAALLGLTLYYGSPVPQSVLAKSRLYGVVGPWTGRIWWEWLSPFALGRWPTASEATHLLPLTVLFAPAVVVGAARLRRVWRDPLALAIAAGLVVWLGYSLLGVAYFYWYFMVPLAALALLAAVGLPQLLRGRAVYVALVLYVLGTWTIVPVLYLGRAQNEILGFSHVGEFLLENARPGDKVMLEPIGMVGYTAPVFVIDEVGLVSPRVARRRLQGPGWYTDIAEHERPDWLVLRRGVLRQGTAFAGAGAPFRNLVERDSLIARYRLALVTNEMLGDQTLEVYHRAR